MGEVGREAVGEAWERFATREPRLRMRAHEARVMTFTLFASATWHWMERDGNWGELVLSLLSVNLIWVASILLHEVGHALAARAVDLEPVVMLVGGGRSLLRREIFGVALNLGAWPGSGLTMIVGRPGQQRLKWRLLAAYAGGPLVTVGLLLLGLLGFRQEWASFRAGTDTWITPGTALIVVNALLLLTVIVPLPRASDVASMGNDLMQIMRLPGLPPSRLAALASAGAGAQVNRLYALGKYQAAFEAARARLAIEPANWTLRMQVAHMLVFAGRYADAPCECAWNTRCDPDRARAVISRAKVTEAS